jgi:hypothetical protein
MKDWALYVAIVVVLGAALILYLFWVLAPPG